MLINGVEVAELLWHRRHALQIAMQLPDNFADALLVLEATRDLVQNYLGEDFVRPVEERPLVDLPAEREACVVLEFPALSSSAADANR